MARRSALATGALLALFAALSFGAATPIIARAGQGIGPLSTAGLLYAGACLSALVLGRLALSSGAPFRRAHAGRLIAVALFGAGIAPTLLAWGLQRAGATTGALLLNLEAVFTVLLARIVYRESIGRRVSLALLLMASGGVALGLEAGFSKGFSLWGALAVALATLSWALDNTLTRGLAEQDPVHVVALKGALGASITLSAAVLWREPVPGLRAAIVIALAGATGYGLSLRLYLLAQRRIGAARTGSIFAIAPFVGAALSWAIGDKAPGPLALGAAVLFGLGVWLHATERHEHRHAHPVVDHEHAHRHDDGHHHHHHDPPFLAEHSHPHHHDLLEHDHDHAPDVHHDHSHST